MNIIQFVQDKARLIILLFAFIVLAGGYATYSIPKESEPDVKIPIIYVIVQHNGISAEDSVNLLVKPIEREVRSIEGIKEIRSNGFESGGSVTMEFKAGFDSKKAIADVREAVNKAKAQLPRDSQEPSIYEVNLSLFPVLSILLYGDVEERIMLKAARQIKDALKAIPQILSADIIGDKDQLAEIIISPNKITEYKIRADEIAEALGNANVLVAAGALENGSGKFSVKIPGLITNAQELAGVPIKKNGDKVITLGDIAELRYGYKDSTSFARVDGQPALAIQIKKRTGENIIETIEQAKLVLAEAQKLLPPAIKIQTIQDKSHHIQNMLTELTNSIFSAVLLVIAVILAFLGFRSGILVALSVPGSFFGGVLALYIGGYSVNVVVLFTLILSVGMLVDDAIVVAEYAARRIGQGMAIPAAYREASTRMAAPIITSTLTKILVFLPLLFWPGIVGQFIRYMPITLTAVLTASLIFALIFVPVLGSNMDNLKRLFVYFAIIGLFAVAGNLILGKAGLFLGVLIGVIIIALYVKYHKKSEKHESENQDYHEMTEDEQNEPLPTSGFGGLYVKILSFIANYPVSSLVFAFILLIASYAAYGKFGKGVTFFPDIEPERFVVDVSARGNLSIADKLEIMIKVENEILQYSQNNNGLGVITTLVGSGGQQAADDVIGQMQIELSDWKTRPSAEFIMTDLRKDFEKFGGISVFIHGEQGGPKQNKPITLQVRGDDRDAVQKSAELILNQWKDDARLKDVASDLPIPKFNWQLKVNRVEAAKYNISIGLIGNFVQMLTQGVKGAVIRPNDTDKEVDVVVRFPEEFRNLDNLDKIKIQTPKGAVPLSYLVTRQAVPDVGTIRRIDEKNAFKLEANVIAGTLPNTEIERLTAILKNTKFPEGISYKFVGEQQDQKESQAFLGKAFATAIIMIALLMLLEFNSFSSCLFILTSVIMSSAGVLLGLILTDRPFGIVMSGIGLVALSGIVVNNNIVLIDTYDNLRRIGVEPLLAIKKAAYQRFRPVFLTSLCTVLGLIPIAAAVNIDFVHRVVDVGGPSTQWWLQLSTAIAFGMTFATPFTLLITPAMIVIREKYFGLITNEHAPKAGFITKLFQKKLAKIQPHN